VWIDEFSEKTKPVELLEIPKRKVNVLSVSKLNMWVNKTSVTIDVLCLI